MSDDKIDTTGSGVRRLSALEALRKQAEGKTKLEAIRRLKRHLARRIWRVLHAAEIPATPPVSINRSNPEIPTFT